MDFELVQPMSVPHARAGVIIDRSWEDTDPHIYAGRTVASVKAASTRVEGRY